MKCRRASGWWKILWIVVFVQVIAAGTMTDGEVPAVAPASAAYFPDQPRTGFVDALADFLDLVIPQALATLAPL